MQNNLYELHKHCEMLIDYTRINAHHRPALCCATCVDKKGRPQWIDWVAKQDEDYLIEGLCVDTVGNPGEWYKTQRHDRMLKQYLELFEQD